MMKGLIKYDYILRQKDKTLLTAFLLYVLIKYNNPNYYKILSHNSSLFLFYLL